MVTIAICVELLSLKATNFCSKVATSLDCIIPAKSFTNLGGDGLSGIVCPKDWVNTIAKTATRK